jgi:hypothetical protein
MIIASSCYFPFSTKQTSVFVKAVNLWKNTFQNETESFIEHKIQQRKEYALKIKQNLKIIPSTQISLYNSKIPQWKRNALTIISSSHNIPTHRKANSLFALNPKYVFKRITNNIHLPLFMKHFYYNSNLYPIISDLKQSYSNIKYNFTFSTNPFITIPRKVYDKVRTQLGMNGINILKKTDPNFTITNFEKEKQVIFKQYLTLSRSNDINTIKKIAGESALAQIKNEIKDRINNKYTFLIQSPIYVDLPIYSSCDLIDGDNNIVLKFKVNTIESTARVCFKSNNNNNNKNKYVIKNKNGIESNQYLVDVIRNPVPFEDEFGHCYMIIGCQKIENAKQLI